MGIWCLFMVSCARELGFGWWGRRGWVCGWLYAVAGFCCLLVGFGLLWFVVVGVLILVVLVLVFSNWLGGWFGLWLSVVELGFVGLCRFEGLWV